jgi:GDPmannose 4,6-dehydratase
MFGKAPAPQGEDTPFAPTSTYACAKIAAYYNVIHHRNAFGLFAAQGILFNHESERRPETFVSRKITKAAARIKLGLQSELRLGNLETGRDWGYARDYVRAMHLMLQHDTPEEFVIGTGVCTSIQDFLDKSFSYFDLNWQDYVVQDPKFMRPLDHHELRGDYSKAKRLLGWEPETNIDQLVEIMCAHDYKVEGGDKPQMWFTSSTPEGVIVTGSDHEIKPIGAEAHGVCIIKKYDKPIYTCGGGPQTNK